MAFQLCMHANIQVCKIVEGQRYSKRLNEKQITALLRVTCQRPQERELDILQVIMSLFLLLSALWSSIVMETYSSLR